MSSFPSNASVNRILVRSVNWLGDAVMTTPALIRLRERFPRAAIHILTPQKLAQLWEHFPGIQGVMTFTPDEGLMSVARRIRAERFDLGITFPNSTRTALELWAGRVRHRVGYGGRGRFFLLNHRVGRAESYRVMRKKSPAEVRRLLEHPAPVEAVPVEAHQLYHYLHLVSAAGASGEATPPQLAVTEAETKAFRATFLEGIGEGTELLGLNAGAEYGPAKRWPADRFVAAASAVAQSSGVGWLLFGGPADRPLTDRIEQALRAKGVTSPIINVAGRTSLRQLMAGLKLCRALLTNDSGPMHVAAALGTPVVVPFGSTSPELTAPGLPGDPKHQLLRAFAPCSPCFQRECPVDFRCMEGIQVEQVIGALKRAMGNAGVG